MKFLAYIAGSRTKDQNKGSLIISEQDVQH